MKTLIMCEGNNELAIIDILLDNDLLAVTRDELIDMRAFHARQLRDPLVSTALGIYLGEFRLWRIGDKQNDRLKSSDVSKYKDRLVEIKRYCTLPELEILLIISEGKWNEYKKTASRITPKEFAKANVLLGKTRYNNRSEFYHAYYDRAPDKLVDAIIEYKRIHKTHDKDQLYLADLLKIK